MVEDKENVATANAGEENPSKKAAKKLAKEAQKAAKVCIYYTTTEYFY